MQSFVCTCKDKGTLPHALAGLSAAEGALLLTHHSGASPAAKPAAGAITQNAKAKNERNYVSFGQGTHYCAQSWQ